MKRLLALLLFLAPTLGGQGSIPQTTYTTLPSKPYAAVVTTVSAGPLTATQSISTLCSLATCSAGQYGIDWVFWGSGTACATVTAGQVVLALTWTDKQGTSHAGLIMLMLTQTTATGMANQANFHFETSLANEGSGGSYVLNTNGAADIQYTMTYTACTSGTGTYNFMATVRHLQ